MTDLAGQTDLDFESLARHFDRMQRMSNSGSWEWDIVNNGLIWSPQIYRIFGLSPNAFAPNYPAFLERVHPDDRHIVELGVQRAIEGLEPYRVDHRIVLPDGAVRIVHEVGEVEFAPDGTAIRMLGAISDVTETRAQTETLQTELAEINRMSVMAENLAGVGYWRFVPATQSRAWSPSTFAIFGLDPADGPPPQGGIGMFDPKDQELLRSAVAGQGTGHPADYEYPITRVDGGRRYVRMAGSLERDADGGVSHLYGVMIDVTNAKLREQAIAQSEARYRLLADSVSDVIVRYDAHGVIEFISPSVRAFGYQADDIVGRLITEFEAAGLGSEALEELAQHRAGLLFPDGRLSETQMQRGDGTTVWMESVETGLYDAAGVFIGVVAVLRDVTERRAMTEELQRKQIEAEAASVAKGEFLANMSHEIRTPLNAVIGFAQALEGLGELSDRARTYVSRIVTSGHGLLQIVNDVLDFSRLEAGKVALDPQPLELAPFLDDTLAMVLPEAGRKGLTVDLQPREDLPRAVLADAGRLRQVLLNLLGNAVKFVDQGRVTLRCSPDTAGRLRFEVTDTGVGIAPEDVDRLFRRFSQVDGSNTRQHGGSGLGLAISKALVEAMGGEIGVESLVGQGSTFWFTIEAPGIDEKADPAAGIGAAASGEAPHLRPLEVLAVDDLAMNRELMSILLEPFDVKITQASNGLEAVEAADRTAFDVILMDLQMPVMDGLAATREIRASSRLNRATPVLAVTANVLPPHIEACLAAGMNDHISKPILPEDFLDKIARWAGLKDLGEATLS